MSSSMLSLYDSIMPNLISCFKVSESEPEDNSNEPHISEYHLSLDRDDELMQPILGNIPPISEYFSSSIREDRLTTKC